MFEFFGTCEYCDHETTVTHFPNLGINACDMCACMHDLEAAEAKYV
jgi:hypothetical protein